jgi:hypothetical protein
MVPRVTGSARLFQLDPHYRETRLLKDLSRPRIYYTLDYWDSETSFDQFKAANREAYTTSDRTTEPLTLSERTSPASISKTSESLSS